MYELEENDQDEQFNSVSADQVPSMKNYKPEQKSKSSAYFKNIKCRFCDYIANSVQGIRCHERYNNDKNPEPVFCGMCEYKSCTKNLMIRHQEKEHGVNLMKEDSSSNNNLFNPDGKVESQTIVFEDNFKEESYDIGGISDVPKPKQNSNGNFNPINQFGKQATKPKIAEQTSKPNYTTEPICEATRKSIVNVEPIIYDGKTRGTSKNDSKITETPMVSKEPVIVSLIKSKNSNGYEGLESESKPVVPERLKCRFCDFEAKTLKGIKNHERPNMKLQENERMEPYVCQFCNYKSCTKLQQKLHKEIKHGLTPVVEKIKCEFCDYSTDDPRRLSKHKSFKNESTETKLYQCELCLAKSCSEMALIQHKKFRHSGKQPTKKIVKKRKKSSYPTFSSISKSMNIPYDCDLCGVVFNGQKSFDRHLSMFHNRGVTHPVGPPRPRPSPCSPTNFSDLTATPQRSWDGKTLYQCFICTFASKYPYNVIRHVQSHHQKNVHISDLKIIPVTQENIPPSKKSRPRGPKFLSMNNYKSSEPQSQIIESEPESIMKSESESTEIMKKPSFRKVYYVLPKPTKGEWRVTIENNVGLIEKYPLPTFSRLDPASRLEPTVASMPPLLETT